MKAPKNLKVIYKFELCKILPKDIPNFCSKYLLMSENNVDGNTRTLFLHETCATDTDNVKRVFADVKVTVFRKAIRDIMY